MAPRSRTGCLTCRQRKLKCSEERPVCAQCLKANRDCVPASAITFRHQQNPSMTASQRGSDQLKSFYGYKETFSKETTWVHIPHHLTFVTTTNPYADDDAAAAHHPHSTPDLFHPSPPAADAGLASSLAALAEDAARYEQVRSEPDYNNFTPTVSDYATHGLEALSAVATQDQYNYAPPPAPMSHGDQLALQSPSTTSPLESHATPSGPPNTTTNNNLDFLLNPPAATTPADNPNIDPRLHSEPPINNCSQPPDPTASAQRHPTPTHVRTPTYASSSRGPRLHSKGLHARRPSIDDPQLAFLLRDFSERSGLWMDLFDLNLFFATKVPVLAKQCPLLLYSCAALSAKSLARVDGRKPTMGGQVTTERRSSMEVWPGLAIDALGYVQKAREYYDLAVSLLRQSLAGATAPQTPSLPGNLSPQTARNAQSMSLPPTDSDELVAATAILCVYEFLDASGPEWGRHLDGAKTLFVIANDRMVPLHFQLPRCPDSEAHSSDHRPADHLDVNRVPSRTLSQGRRAVFWNFARQDMLSAFLNSTSTRLDTSDMAMWKSAGLRFTAEGYICPSNPAHPDYDPDKAMEDDIVANALIWIIMKLVNLIAAGDDAPEHPSPMEPGVRQHTLREHWGEI
ncbi:Fungal specific transcription factor domain [Teratosphaeria destructans]|uniref:Fungal specific transcription factor domain n=1 Tax=Teratosphaeria destructans TaxID=418781 RepID=A0A9W7SLZ3_9PEZI|nr:Fungal specific transcription factor domain [Teratosphaeria destructans]